MASQLSFQKMVDEIPSASPAIVFMLIFFTECRAELHVGSNRATHAHGGQHRFAHFDDLLQHLVAIRMSRICGPAARVAVSKLRSGCVWSDAQSVAHAESSSLESVRACVRIESHHSSPESANRIVEALPVVGEVAAPWKPFHRAQLRVECFLPTCDHVV